MKIKVFATPILLFVGYLSIAIAVIGIFIPLLPTTPFLLLAAACLSKGSTRVHDWLVNRSPWAPLLSDWEQNGTIAKKTKVLATVLMISMSGYALVAIDFHIYLKASVVLIIVLVLAFIWTRPSK